MSTFEPTCNLRIVKTHTSGRLQQWWRKLVDPADWMHLAVLNGAIPDPEGEWRDVPIVEPT